METYRTPMLDNGHVELFAASPGGEKMRHILYQHYGKIYKPSILSIPRVVFSIKCPIAIVMTMTRLNLVTDLSSEKKHAFNPTVEHISSGNLENDQNISESIAMTNESLMLNQKAYAEDNCDRFIATLTTPISAYWEGLVYGDLLTWIEFTESKHAPRVVGLFQKEIRNILTAEYGMIFNYGKGLHT
jgi:hypothetical protein